MYHKDLKQEIINGIESIKTFENSDYLKVAEIYSTLSKKFLKYKQKDFQGNKRVIHQTYLKFLLIMEAIYKNEIISISNQEVDFINCNYSQVKLSLISYVDWLDVD